MHMRIGHGFDVHKFSNDVDNKGIVIGGVSIPYERSLVAHSDGDVLIHALCDALLGAAALGDIGHHFPDTDDSFKNANSRDLLKNVMLKIHKLGYVVSNIDSTIVAQSPKMATHINVMRENIAEDLAVSTDQVNVKATTTEKLGFEGRKEGISAHAVVLLNAAKS